MPPDVAAPDSASGRWLAVAEEIGEKLCHDAYRYGGECTWMGTVHHGGAHERPHYTWETLRSDLYGGASGVALFLAELFARTGRERFRETAIAALRFSAARFDQVPHSFRQGFYSGRIGIAFALARGGDLLGEPTLTAAAMRELDDRAIDDNEGILLDIISGAAGSIAPLLYLARSHARADLRTLAIRFGDLIIAAASKDATGWNWGNDATGFETERPLTGYGHGAAGIGVALLELFAATGDTRFRDAGREAFRYETSLFRPARDNWPDFRYTADSGEHGHFGVAWCVGAPGIGLSRLGAIEVELGDSPHQSAAVAQLRMDAEAALRTVQRQFENFAEPGSADFSLCHGWAGLGDFALIAAGTLGSSDAREMVERIAHSGAASNAGFPGRWHCGLEHGTHPSLMLGLAGIGHFYLRLADPTVPSLTLVRSQPAAR